jgi:hypothetical protein
MRDSFSSLSPCSRYWPPVMMQVPSRTEKRKGSHELHRLAPLVLEREAPVAVQRVIVERDRGPRGALDAQGVHPVGEQALGEPALRPPGCRHPR